VYNLVTKRNIKSCKNLKKIIKIAVNCIMDDNDDSKNIFDFKKQDIIDTYINTFDNRQNTE